MQTTAYPSDKHLVRDIQTVGRIARRAPVDAAGVDVVSDTALRNAANDADMLRLPPPTAMPSSVELHAAARAGRARQISALIVRALRWLDGWFNSYLAQRRQRAVARSTYRTLRALDARTLRDLGIERSEILSFALGTGRDHASAMQAIRAANGLRLF